MRVKFDKNMNLIPQQTEKSSTFLWHEWPLALLEYAPDKIIALLSENTFLFLNDWIPMCYIKDEFQNKN